MNVHSDFQAEYALDQLATWDTRKRLQFNFTSLCESSKPLKSGFKLESPSKTKKRKKKKKNFKPTDSDSNNLATEGYEFKNSTRQTSIKNSNTSKLFSGNEGAMKIDFENLTLNRDLHQKLNSKDPIQHHPQIMMQPQCRGFIMKVSC